MAKNKWIPEGWIPWADDPRTQPKEGEVVLAYGQSSKQDHNNKMLALCVASSDGVLVDMELVRFFPIAYTRIPSLPEEIAKI